MVSRTQWLLLGPESIPLGKLVDMTYSLLLLINARLSKETKFSKLAMYSLSFADLVSTPQENDPL